MRTISVAVQANGSSLISQEHQQFPQRLASRAAPLPPLCHTTHMQHPTYKNTYSINHKPWLFYEDISSRPGLVTTMNANASLVQAGALPLGSHFFTTLFIVLALLVE